MLSTLCTVPSSRPDVGVLSTQANFAADPEAAQAVLSAGFRSAILGNLGNLGYSVSAVSAHLGESRGVSGNLDNLG